MASKGLLRVWLAARDDLGIQIVFPFSLDLGGGTTIKAELLVKDFGALHGMLVLADSYAIMPYSERVITSGYGYSVMDFDAGEEYDRAIFIDILSDWTWSGPKNKKPLWLVG